MSGTGEELERPGPLFGRMHEQDEEEEEEKEEEDEEKIKARKPTCPGDKARDGTCVAMATASSDSDVFQNSSSDRGDLYTSLLSSNISSLNSFSASVPLVTEDHRSPLPPLGSDSGMEMTPADPGDQHTHKTEPYNYMDMSDDLCNLGNRSNTGSKGQPIRNLSDGDEDDEDDEDGEDDGLGPTDFNTKTEKEAFDFGSYLEKNPEKLTIKGYLGNTVPYVEDQSDDELAENRPCTASPVKITVTTDSCIPATEQTRAGVWERESVLSLGKEGVPMVTLSEPEDDSAASSVNHSPNHSPTGRESPSDFLFQPVRMKCVNNATLYQDTKVPTKHASRFDMRDSGESGDSEIEPDSPKHKRQFGVKHRPGNPFDPTASGLETKQSDKAGSNDSFRGSVPTTQECVQHGNPPLYSLLREEREAELDSDLLIESASEESPKREQVVKCTLKPHSPVSGAVLPPQQNRKQEVKEEKSIVAPVAEFNTRPQQQDDKILTKVKPAATASFVRRPLEDEGNKYPTISSEDKKDPKEEFLMFLHRFNKKKVVEVLLWRDVKKTGVLFSSVLLLLFSLTQFSMVSVMAYLALAALSTTISFRVYKCVLQAVQKTDDGHPFKTYLEQDMSLSPERISKYVEKVQLYVNYTVKELRRLFLVQDLIDSLKFAVLMWLLTYVGALFNGLTLLILAVVCVFTLPLVYEKYQKQIDQYLGLVRAQVNSVMAKLREKVPGAKRKEE